MIIFNGDVTEMTDEMRRDDELQRVATAAAQRAADLVNAAAISAHQVTAASAATAQVLAESTKVDLRHMQKDLEEIKSKLDNKFVTVEAFEPVRKLVYGLVTIILAGVVGGLLALVLKS